LLGSVGLRTRVRPWRRVSLRVQAKTHRLPLVPRVPVALHFFSPSTTAACLTRTQSRMLPRWSRRSPVRTRRSTADLPGDTTIRRESDELPRQEWHDERHGRLVSSGFPPGSGRGTFSRARSARRVLFDRSEHNAGVPRVAFYRCAGDQTGWLSLLPAARVSLRGLLPSAFMSQMSLLPSRWRTYAIFCPSGDQ
jgi:hypothetical protein